MVPPWTCHGTIERFATLRNLTRSLPRALPATGQSWRHGAPVPDPAMFKRARHTGSETGAPVGRGRVPPPSLIACLSLRTPGHVRAAERAAAATKDSKYTKCRRFGVIEEPAGWVSRVLFVSASFFVCLVCFVV